MSDEIDLLAALDRSIERTKQQRREGALRPQPDPDAEAVEALAVAEGSTTGTGIWRWRDFLTQLRKQGWDVVRRAESCYTVPDGPKMLRESLCMAQAWIGQSDDPRKAEHIDRLGRLIEECDRHRPLGADGKHDERHTPTCGCDLSCERAPERGDVGSLRPPRRR